ncbi:MAG: DNA internalization-related competence protein ComEC/Rec2 [Pseudomonadota bacterium]
MPVRLLILAFVCGAAWLQTRPELPDMRWAWLLPPLLLLTGGLPRSRARAGLALVLAGLLGFTYATWRAEVRMADALTDTWTGRDLVLEGRVLGLPELTPRGWRTLFEPTRVLTPGARVPTRVQLSHVSFAAAPPAPRGGQCLRLVARLAPPRGSVNPGGFDYEGWLFERGIRAQGYLVQPEAISTRCPFSLRARIDAVREAVRTRLARALVGQPYAGVVIALAIGDQNAISEAQWTLFRQTGVIHLMSISGLHVTLLAALVHGLVNLAWRRMPGLVLRWPARHAAALAGLLAALGYVALSGFGVPAQRTLYMLGGLALGVWLGRGDSPSRLLAGAALGVALIDPWAMLAPGFWLSFGAVAVLMYAGAGRVGRLPPWRRWIGAQGAVTLALVPALLWWYQEVSLVSPVANALAIPVVSLGVVPLALAASLPGLEGVAQIAHLLLTGLMACLAWLADGPLAVWPGMRPGWPAFLLALLGVALMLAPRGWPGRWVGGLCLLPLFWPRLEALPREAFQIDVLDVGQGQAVVLRTARHTLVYDAGPRYASGEDAGERIVIPYLRGQGVFRVDALMLSHLDTDHAGGAEALLRALVPRIRWTSEHRQGFALCQAGQSWRWDGVTFTVLHPPSRYYGQPGFDDNERSCVLKVASPWGAVLLTGDIGRLGELSLLETVPAALASDIVVVAHHGSSGSSMAEFVRAARPRHAVISVGWGNRYGHPTAEVLARYRAAGAHVSRTDHEGAIRIRASASGLRLTRARDSERRYWHDRP